MHVIRHFHPLHFELRFLQNEIKNSDELVQGNVTHINVFFFSFLQSGSGFYTRMAPFAHLVRVHMR